MHHANLVRFLSRLPLAFGLLFIAFTKTANAQGEIGPHFLKDRCSFIGEVYGNSVYINADDEGRFGNKSQDGTVYADVWVAREDFYIMFRHPKKDAYAMVDSADPTFSKKKFSELEFGDFHVDSLPHKAWIRASSPKSYEKDRKTGKEFAWIYVDAKGDRKQTDRFYVSPEIKLDSSTGCRFVTVMIVNEQRFSVFIDPAKRRFSTELTDRLAMPVEEKKFSQMKRGDLSEAILGFMNRKK